MGYSYIILAAAQEELESSINWYLERSYVSAEHFLDSFSDTVELICDHPYRWRNEYSYYHELNLKKFPYSIVYTIDEEQQLIVIESIYHHKRNPKSKYLK